MDIQKNYDLQSDTTFGISTIAQYFCQCLNEDDLKEAILFAKAQDVDFLILGGGSNVLFTKDFNGLVIKLSLKGIELTEVDQNEVIVSAQAGEVWHDLVLFSINKGLGGLENMSLIPGSVGAAPMQNIGAYGVEIKDVFYNLRALNLTTGEIENFTREACEFGYRFSAFKGEKKGKYVILSVSLKLNKKAVLNTSYGAIKEKLNELKVEHPTIKDVSNAVISIRKSKLPDPKEIGNAGSFFKNPIVDKSVLEKIEKKYKGCPYYSIDENNVKLPAGYLIEKAGWKGKRYGDAGVHKNQALVLVNYGNATGQEVLELSEKIQESIRENFGIELEREVNII